jgi:hypothetical protein
VGHGRACALPGGRRCTRLSYQTGPRPLLPIHPRPICAEHPSRAPRPAVSPRIGTVARQRAIDLRSAARSHVRAKASHPHDSTRSAETHRVRRLPVCAPGADDSDRRIEHRARAFHDVAIGHPELDHRRARRARGSRHECSLPFQQTGEPMKIYVCDSRDWPGLRHEHMFALRADGSRLGREESNLCLGIQSASCYRLHHSPIAAL